jgi:hypothetical protein
MTKDEFKNVGNPMIAAAGLRLMTWLIALKHGVFLQTHEHNKLTRFSTRCVSEETRQEGDRGHEVPMV